MQKYLRVGKIANTHGVKGELKIIPLTDDPERYNDLKYVYLDRKDDLEKIDIEQVKFLKSFVIVKFKGVDDMDCAESLKDLYLLVDRENAVKLPEGSYFISDLVGCSVYDENGECLGELTDVLETGSNDVYSVKDKQGGREILIPALKNVVKRIDLNSRKIEVLLPEGLMDE